MLPISDLVGALAVAGKLFKEIKAMVKTVYGDKALKKAQLYEIIRKVKEGKLVADQRLFNGKGESVIRLSLPMSPPKSPMTGLSPSGSGPWCVDQDYQHHSPRGSSPVKNVGSMGSQASEPGDQKRGGEEL